LLFKNRFVSTRWPSVHMKSVVERGFSMNSHLTTKLLKHLSHGCNWFRRPGPNNLLGIEVDVKLCCNIVIVGVVYGVNELRLSSDAETAKHSAITTVLQLCVFPRCCFTSIDAIFCAKFLYIMHSLKTPNFSSLICYDRVFLLRFCRLQCSLVIDGLHCVKCC